MGGHDNSSATTLVGRLAPSPTGVLHLGNARSFLLAWLSVRCRGGRVWLRIEDIDGPRVKAGAEVGLLEDLAWLGLDFDGEPLRQSERTPVYAAFVDELLDRGLAYPCVCSRREVEAAASAPHEAWLDAAPYPGTCRDRFRSIDAARAETGREPAIRFRVDVDAMPFMDGFLGAQEGKVLGDFVIERHGRLPAYQLAVVVDDVATGVTEVLRGDDLLPSTPRQLLLYRAFSWSTPRFIHVPLVVGADRRRLAKRHGDTSLRFLRQSGVDPARLVGWLASTCGLRPTDARCRPADLVEDFTLERLPRHAVRGDDHRLLDRLHDG